MTVYCGTDLVSLNVGSFMLIRLCRRLKALVSRALNVAVRSRCEGWLLPSISCFDAHMMPIKADKTNPLTTLEQICCAMADVETMSRLEFRFSYRCTVLIRDSVSLPFHSTSLPCTLHHHPFSRSNVFT